LWMIQERVKNTPKGDNVLPRIDEEEARRDIIEERSERVRRLREKEEAEEDEVNKITAAYLEDLDLEQYGGRGKYAKRSRGQRKVKRKKTKRKKIKRKKIKRKKTKRAR